MSRKRGRKIRKIDMMPLIDLIFLILVVFVVFSLEMTIKKGLDLDLPGAASASTNKEENPPEVISITADGEVFLNDDKMPMNELTSAVKSLKKKDKKTSFSIKGDMKAQYEVLMQVIDALNSAGVHSVFMEAKSCEQ